MSEEKTVLNLDGLSPKAIELLKQYAKHSGIGTIERVVEELVFAAHDLMVLVDTTKDPRYSSQDAVIVLTQIRSVLLKLRRFEEEASKKT